MFLCVCVCVYKVLSDEWIAYRMDPLKIDLCAASGICIYIVKKCCAKCALFDICPKNLIYNRVYYFIVFDFFKKNGQLPFNFKIKH